MTDQPTIANTRGAVLEAVRAAADPLFAAITGADENIIGEFISRGTLNEVLARVKASDLPPIDVHSAEVKTPADVFVDAICPECQLPTRIQIQLEAVLETSRFETNIKLKAKAKARTHVHNQLALEVDDGQEELGLDQGEDVDDDEDLRPTGEVNADELRGAG